MVIGQLLSAKHCEDASASNKDVALRTNVNYKIPYGSTSRLPRYSLSIILSGHSDNNGQ